MTECRTAGAADMLVVSAGDKTREIMTKASKEAAATAIILVRSPRSIHRRATPSRGSLVSTTAPDMTTVLQQPVVSTGNYVVSPGRGSLRADTKASCLNFRTLQSASKASKQVVLPELTQVAARGQANCGP